MKNIFLLLSSIIIFSCSSPLQENGPRLCPSDNFKFDISDLKIEKVIESSGKFTLENLSSGDEIDFVNTGLKFSANFSEEVEWELTISSKKSATKKSYKSKSNKLNIYWYGNSDKLPFFEDEDCEVTFRILCNPIVKLPFSVKGKANFIKASREFGVLIRDWDQNGVVDVIDKTKPVATEATLSIGVFAGAIWPNSDGYFYNPLNIKWFEYSSEKPSPMGGNHLSIEGESNANDSNKNPEPVWYFGANEMLNMQRAFNLLPTKNTDSLYLNFFVRADQNLNGVALKNTEMQIGVINEGVGGGKWIYRQNVNWGDWKLISIKLSDFAIQSGNNRLLSSQRITNIALNLAAGPAQQSIGKIYYDFIYVSVGSPLAN